MARTPLIGDCTFQIHDSIQFLGKPIEVWNDEFYGQLRARDKVESSCISGVEALASEGKGGSPLFASDDPKIIVKEISDGDHAMLLLHGASYLQRMLTGTSMLVPIYLHFYADCPTGGNKKRRYIAMRNLMHQPGPYVAKYDLKGCADDKTLELNGKTIHAVHKRFFTPHMWCSCNWSADRWKYYEGKVRARNLKLELPAQHREKIVRGIAADAAWLAECGLMDYSLLVGIRHLDVYVQPAEHATEFVFQDEVTNEIRVLTLGIIDFLQPWNCGKTAAQYVKILETNKATIPPRDYAERFKSHFAQRLQSNETLKLIGGAESI